MANIEEAQVRLGEIPKLQAELIAKVVEPGKSSVSRLGRDALNSKT